MPVFSLTLLGVTSSLELIFLSFNSKFVQVMGLPLVLLQEQFFFQEGCLNVPFWQAFSTWLFMVMVWLLMRTHVAMVTTKPMTRLLEPQKSRIKGLRV